MTAKPIATLNLSNKRAPEAIEIINRLAVLEDRPAHQAAERLILAAGPARIRELESQRSDPAGTVPAGQ